MPGAAPDRRDRWEARRSGPHTRKHRQPCGQPAVVGEIGGFRPLPAQTGQTVRINATPSDLPFKSTGFAIYPVPPQFGQSPGSTPLPLSWLIRLCTIGWQIAGRIVLCYEKRTRFPKEKDEKTGICNLSSRPRWLQKLFAGGAGARNFLHLGHVETLRPGRSGGTAARARAGTSRASRRTRSARA